MRVIAASLALSASVGFAGCSGSDKHFAHELKVFALAYHEMAQGQGQLSVDEVGGAHIDWQGRPGPAKLEDMAGGEHKFSEVARRIREGTFVVVWKARLRPTAEENAKYFLGHERGIEIKGGWVLRADGWPEKVSAEGFKKLKPIPSG